MPQGESYPVNRPSACKPLREARTTFISLSWVGEGQGASRRGVGQSFVGGKNELFRM